MADQLTKVMTVNYPSRMRQIPTACGVVHSYLSGGTSGVSEFKVASGDLKDTDVLIGMDVISMGDFAVTARNGCTKFSFQIPSTHDIDFSAEAAR